MWLLNTTSWTLHYFNTCTEVDYATLSHVWHKEGEQSFQDIARIHEEARRLVEEAGESGSVDVVHSPSYRVAVLRRLSPKIRDSCAIARLDGHLWLWVDTCCIDKTSSAELSEAINSMFTWYANSATCYAFLHDVSDLEDPFRSDSSLRGSEWFERGWTLQELIAPQLVVFVSREWRVLGTKHSMAEVVAEVTGIEVDILMNTKSLDDISIARRMSWASSRKTTRLEDEAYSLMGIFGVHMPTIYGEGRDAFIRLQEEILKRSPDQSLFAWGPSLPVDPEHIPSACWLEKFAPSVDGRDTYLFASSSADFSGNSGDVRPIDVADLSRRLKSGGHLKADLSPPAFVVTAHGVRATLPVLEISLPPYRVPLQLVALACEHTFSGHLFALILLPTGANRYRIGRTWEDSDNVHPDVPGGVFRLVTIGLSFIWHRLTAVRLNEIYISHRMPAIIRPRLPLFSGGKIRRPLKLIFPQWLMQGVRDRGYTFVEESSFVLRAEECETHTAVLVPSDEDVHPFFIKVHMTLGDILHSSHPFILHRVRVRLEFEDHSPSSSARALEQAVSIQTVDFGTEAPIGPDRRLRRTYTASHSFAGYSVQLEFNWLTEASYRLGSADDGALCVVALKLQCPTPQY